MTKVHRYGLPELKHLKRGKILLSFLSPFICITRITHIFILITQPKTSTFSNLSYITSLIMSFDPSRPIDDEKVWFPKGMFVDNRTNSRFASDPEDDDRAFIFNSSDMKALNRFLGTGRLLPTTRNDYLRSLGILTTDPLSLDLGKEVDSLVTTYTKIKADCVYFREHTWRNIVDMAAQIRIYATMAGGTEETSYTVLMLKWIGDFHDENNKPKPDQARLKELKEGIQFVVDEELRIIKQLQAGAQEALAGLENFHGQCEQHESHISINATSLDAQLIREGNDIASMQKKIDAARAELEEYQARIDDKNKVLTDAPKYMWVWPIGTFIGVGLVQNAKNEIKGMREAMEKVQAVMDEYEAKHKTASRLQLNIMFVNSQVNNLTGEIRPAMRTLELLQGAWISMVTDLETIKQLINNDTDNIPPMILAKPQLQKIVNEWNELRDFASNYIQNSYLSESPENVSVEQYIHQLETRVFVATRC
ncbi:cf2bf657-6cf4-4c0e-a4aa-4d25ddde8687 [Sclerotinia trifoliorum]|uniref:Cf2bf657-6cf4-4c0e-a4aa-4d25ddde8687 n=1 Tax=Sclerotinia trifoliorum TaxID=28548 RepID=A0A8H2ZUC8_9HELO|nr:cf2bf657-6cf4-4c0e-a4aa-4d25ddde8687 [Sclerotinia trifoliorum]